MTEKKRLVGGMTAYGRSIVMKIETSFQTEVFADQVSTEDYYTFAKINGVNFIGNGKTALLSLENLLVEISEYHTKMSSRADKIIWNMRDNPEFSEEKRSFR